MRNYQRGGDDDGEQGVEPDPRVLRCHSAHSSTVMLSVISGAAYEGTERAVGQDVAREKNMVFEVFGGVAHICFRLYTPQHTGSPSPKSRRRLQPRQW